MTRDEVKLLVIQEIRRSGMIGYDADTAIGLGVSQQELDEIILEAIDEAMT